MKNTCLRLQAGSSGSLTDQINSYLQADARWRLVSVCLSDMSGFFAFLVWEK